MQETFFEKFLYYNAVVLVTISIVAFWVYIGCLITEAVW